MHDLQQLVVKIIREQELVIGPLAWNEAGKVQGLRIVSKETAQIEFVESDRGRVIDRLVAQYERLFGRASHEVCREAAASLVAHMAPAEIPSSLR